MRSLRSIMPAAIEPNPSMPRNGKGEAVCGRRPALDPLLEVAVLSVAAAPCWLVSAEEPLVAVPVVEPVVPVEVWFWSGEVAVDWLAVEALLPVVELLPVLVFCAQAMAPPSSNIAANRKILFIDSSPICLISLMRARDGGKG